MKTRLVEGLRVCDLGDEVVVLDPAGEQVHRVDGDALAVLRLLAEGDDRVVDIPDDLRLGLDDLVEAGVVETPAGWSRRKVLLAGGAVWTAATVSTFGLADPAAAQTHCADGWVATPTPATYDMTGTTQIFRTGPAGIGTGMGASFMLTVHTWGGGGGGGGGALFSTGGGGGGGAYHGGSITVTECTEYAVAVGTAGAGGGSTGGSGTSSGFGGILQANAGKGGTQGGYLGAGSGGEGGSFGTGYSGYAGGKGGMGGDPEFLSGWRGGGGGGGAGGTGYAGTNGGDGGGDGTEAGTVRGAAGPGGSLYGGDGGQGGAGALVSENPPDPGVVPGGGGGGGGQAGSGHFGGAGARGEVRVE